MPKLRILHTADWHLGRDLAGVDRTQDFERFLAWLTDEVRTRRPDVLLVAGDVFNTSMPSNAAQKLYYDFVRKIAETDVAAVIVTAGNHDSAYFLGAARGLLEGFRCVVSGEGPEDQAVLVKRGGRVLAAVAAVPYLREGDVTLPAGTALDMDDPAYWRAGVRRHYDRVAAQIDHLLQVEGLDDAAAAAVPRIAMGHLFVTGEGSADKAVSEAMSHYVGSLRHIGLDAFGPGWAYAALGHVHEAQRIRGSVPAWYSGAPLTLRFADRNEEPRILEIDITEEGAAEIRSVPVPQPRRILSLSGDEDALTDALDALKDEAAVTTMKPVAELVYTGADPAGPALIDRLQRRADQTGVLLGAIRLGGDAARRAAEVEESERIRLEEITPEQVFRTVLDARGVEEDVRAPLFARFFEALLEVERDREAEAEEVAKLLKKNADEGKEQPSAEEEKPQPAAEA